MTYPGQHDPTQQPSYPPAPQPTYPQAYPSAYPPASAYPSGPGGQPGPHDPYQPWGQVPSKPSRTMSYWAFGLSFVPGLLTLVGAVLALVVLGRTRGGRGDGGRGFAIAALCITGAWVLLLGGLALAGTLGGLDSRDEAGAVTRTRVVSLADLRVGDCLQLPEREDFSTVVALPCTSEHDGEVYDEFDLPAGAWPGQDAVIALAEQGCADRFGAFVGESFDDSPLEMFYGYPTQLDWSSDTSVSCIVQQPGGGVTGSMAGVGGGEPSDGSTGTQRPA